MSSAIVRRNSSKQGLQNLLRVTAQRSIEDAEEIERERRRRAREALRREDSLTGSATSPRDNAGPSEECLYERDLKPSSPGVLDEDEGFSDWTHRAPEKGLQARQNENGPRAEDVQGERAMNEALGRGEKIASTAITLQQKQSDTAEEEEEHRHGRKSSEKRMAFGKRTSNFQDREADGLKTEVTRVSKMQEVEPRPHTDDKVKEKRKGVRVSYTSKVVLQQDRMPSVNNKGPPAEDETSQFKTRGTSRSVSQVPEPREQVELNLETEERLEKIRRSHQEKESQELEQLRQRQAEAEVELEDLKRRREERRKVREDEERKKEEEEHYRVAKEEEERRQMKEDIERRRSKAAERRLKSLTTSCPDGDDSFNPLSPKSSTLKICPVLMYRA